MPAGVAAAAVAASGGALLIYLLLTCHPQPAPDAEREEEEASPLLSGSGAAQDKREEPWPDRAPVTCCEAASVAARTAQRTWELIVGRWGLHGLTFGIKRHMKRQLRILSASCYKRTPRMLHETRNTLFPYAIILIGMAAASLCGIVVVLAVSTLLRGADATASVKETCQFTEHPKFCEKALSKLVEPESETDATGGSAPAPAPRLTPALP